MMKINFFFIFFFTLFIYFSHTPLFSDQDKTKSFYLLEKPYKIDGIWQYPKENFNYKETGIASIYKSKIDNKNTKNGEIYYKNKISAAHRTLPLPSIVRITNLQNGYSIKLRINDRGPYNNNRIIQLSTRAAEVLKIYEYGLVEVKILPNETMNEYKNLKNIKDISQENLIKSDGLKKPNVDTENLMKNEIKKEKKKYKKKIQKHTEIKNKSDFKRIKIEPHYLRVQIATFSNFQDAADLKLKLRPIYNKILLSLDIIDNQKFYRLKTVPILKISEAEKILKLIQKKGYNNARLVIEKKKK